MDIKTFTFFSMHRLDQRRKRTGFSHKLIPKAATHAAEQAFTKQMIILCRSDQQFTGVLINVPSCLLNRSRIEASAVTLSSVFGAAGHMTLEVDLYVRILVIVYRVWRETYTGPPTISLLKEMPLL